MSYTSHGHKWAKHSVNNLLVETKDLGRNANASGTLRERPYRDKKARSVTVLSINNQNHDSKLPKGEWLDQKISGLLAPGFIRKANPKSKIYSKLLSARSAVLSTNTVASVRGIALYCPNISDCGYKIQNLKSKIE